ncbi:hypothetical protein RIF29_19670 [Crotalaria pallida]|uniref:PB1-like domain-containing protein n=1 Tax=Crotalaria pallida TaxID=3830 RepID=A0AAN9I5P6_CROPI
MDHYFKVGVHHGGHFVSPEKYLGDYAVWNINPDTWSYFELLGILKELAYPVMESMWYRDGKEIKKLVDDGGAAEMEKISRARGIVDFYVIHPVSIPKELRMLPTSEGHVDVNNSKTKEGEPIVEVSDENVVPDQEIDVGESVESVVDADEGEEGDVDEQGKQGEQGDEGGLYEVNIQRGDVEGDVEGDVDVINDGSVNNSYSSNSEDPDYVDEDVSGDSLSDDDLVSEHSVSEGDDTDGSDDSAMGVDSEEEANVGEEIEIDVEAHTNGRKRKAAATRRDDPHAGPSTMGCSRQSDVLPSDIRMDRGLSDEEYESEELDSGSGLGKTYLKSDMEWSLK